MRPNLTEPSSQQTLRMNFMSEPPQFSIRRTVQARKRVIIAALWAGRGERHLFTKLNRCRSSSTLQTGRLRNLEMKDASLYTRAKRGVTAGLRAKSKRA